MKLSWLFDVFRKINLIFIETWELKTAKDYQNCKFRNIFKFSNFLQTFILCWFIVFIHGWVVIFLNWMQIMRVPYPSSVNGNQKSVHKRQNKIWKINSWVDQWNSVTLSMSWSKRFKLFINWFLYPHMDSFSRTFLVFASYANFSTCIYNLLIS